MFATIATVVTLGYLPVALALIARDIRNGGE